jgi:hypothetical protein
LEEWFWDGGGVEGVGDCGYACTLSGGEVW